MTHYPYLDLTVLEKVRDYVVSARAALIFTPDFSQIFWANSEATGLLGRSKVSEVLETRPDLPKTMRRQILSTVQRLSGRPVGESITATIRMSSGWKSRLLGFTVSNLQLPDGTKAILLVSDPLHGQSHGFQDMAASTVTSLVGSGTFSAVLDNAGKIIFASPEFDQIGLDETVRTTLVNEVADESDRLVKRLVETGSGKMAAGIAKLGGSPTCHLLILADGVETAANKVDAARGEDDPATLSLADEAPTAFIDETADEDDEPAPRTAVFSSRRPSLHAGDGGVELERWYFRRSRQDTDAAQEDDQSKSGEAVVEGDLQPPTSPTQTRTGEAESNATGNSKADQSDHDIINLDNVKTVPPADLLLVADETSFETADTGTGTDTNPAIGTDGNEGFQFSSTARLVRFAWRMDAENKFTSISPEFADTVGPVAANVVGNKWADIARAFGFDEDGSIDERLQRGDTWSGKSVLWPVEGTDLRVPVDLAGLPSFSQSREFTGYHGFGTIRAMDAVIDPQETGLALVGKAELQDQIKGPDIEPDAGKSDVRPFTEDDQDAAFVELSNQRSATVVDLTAQREARNARELSDGERIAFAKIADKLSEDQPPSGTEVPEVFETKTPEAEKSGGNEDKEDAGTSIAGFEPEGEEEPEANSDYLPSAFFQSDTNAQINPDTSILANLPIPVLIFKGNTPLFANREFTRLTGFADIEDLDNRGGIETLLGTPDGERDGFTRIIDNSGELIPVKAHLQSVPWDNKRALLLALREDHNLENNLPENATNLPEATDTAPVMPANFADISSKELSGILDTATDGVVVLSGTGEIRSINRAGEALFGIEAEAVKGKDFTELFARESHRAARDYLMGLSDNNVASLLNDGRELIGRESQGGLIPLFVTMGKLEESDSYCAVLRDITQWKKAEEDLVAARRQAELANDQKTDFLAKVSHEIRTPLNAIIGFSEIMLEERFGKIGIDRYREYLRDINRSGSHVLELVNDLLDISKIEAGKLELDFSEVKLNDIIAEGVALSQPQANRDQIIIRTSLSGAVPPVVADPRSIRQIILNLVSNAIKYTKAGGQVIVSTVFEETGEVVLRVRDTGIGMSESEIATALMPFRRVQTVAHHQGEGTGLGLPLTKALVEANRAQFSIESTPGSGTLVEVYFPSTRVLTE